MAIKVVSLLALCISIVHGQRCCYPETWESVNTINVGEGHSGSKKLAFTESTEKLSVDGANHKIASSSTYISGGVHVNLLILQLYDKGVMYTVQNGTCSNNTLPEWTPLCIPGPITPILVKEYSATPVKKTYYGMDENRVDVDVFAMTVGTNTDYVTIAAADCTPVYETAYDLAEGETVLVFKTYSNISLGIKHPSVFDIPSSCTNAREDSQILVRKHGLFLPQK